MDHPKSQPETQTRVLGLRPCTANPQSGRTQTRAKSAAFARLLSAVRWNLEVLQVEARDLLEGGRGDDSAPDRSLGLVDRDEHDEPRGAIWCGTVAAPAFQQIARFDLQYLEVPPDAPGQ